MAIKRPTSNSQIKWVKSVFKKCVLQLKKQSLDKRLALTRVQNGLELHYTCAVAF